MGCQSLNSCFNYFQTEKITLNLKIENFDCEGYACYRINSFKTLAQISARENRR